MTEIALAIRIFVALIFLTAAFGKFRHHLVFRSVVVNYRLLPESAAVAFAPVLPPIEAIVCVGLLFTSDSWPVLGAAALLALFALAMGINIVRGRRHIDCGCFQSALKQTLSWTLVARNVVVALLLASIANVPVNVLTAFGAAEAVLTGTVLFVLLQAMNVLWSVVPSWRQRHTVNAGAEK